MKHIRIFTVLVILTAFTNNQLRSQSVNVTGVTLPSNPTSCGTNTLDISMFIGCINYLYTNAVFTVAGNTINVAVNYSGGAICLGAISTPTHTETFPALAGGTYTVNVSSYLNNTLQSIYPPLSMTVTACAPAANFNLSATSICMPDSILATNTSLSSTIFTWYYDGLFVSNNTNEVFHPNTPGQHTILLIASNGTQLDTFSQIITAFLPAPIVSIGNDTSVCAGDSIVLQLTQPYTNVLWSNGSTANAIDVAVGQYSVTVSEPETCEGSDTIIVSEVALDDLQIAVSGPSNCDVGFLSASIGFFSYEWSNGATSSQISTTVSGNYSVTATSIEGCEVSIEDSITIYESPTVSIGADTTICHNAIWDLVLKTNLQGTHLWSDSSSADSLLISGVFGNYWVSLTDSNGCSGSDTISVLEEFCQSAGVNTSIYENQITLFPNPANDFIHIHSPFEISQIECYSLSGELLQMKNYLPNTSHVLDVSALNGGIYLIVAKTSKQIFYNQVIIMP
jgi:hypothetical protein